MYDNAKLKFEIKDTVSEGLDAPTDIKVADENKTLVENTDYELVKSGKSFTVKLKKEYLLSGDSAKKVTVTYKAKLNSNATSGFDANTNKAEIKYSNSPVSYTHLDVYKRQAAGSANSAIELSLPELERYAHAEGWVDVCKGWE